MLRERGLSDIQLVLVGGKQNGYATVQQGVDSLNLRQHVHFLGYVLDEYMAEIYRRARAMIMPTFFGPTNIPPLEAAAVGCPMALSGIYGMPEQMGDAALFFDPNSTESMADAIGRLWVDDALCADLAAKGRAKHAAWNQVQFNLRLKEIVQKLI